MNLHICALLAILLSGLAYSQEQVAEPATETPEKSLLAEERQRERSMSTQPYLATVEKWDSRVDDLIRNIFALQKDAFDADDLYMELDSALRARVRFLNNALKGAKSPQDNVKAAALPGGMRTIDDLDDSVEVMYKARLRLIEYITPTLHLEVTATDVLGVQTLNLEISYIWQQIRFQMLNIPGSVRDLMRRIRIAPLPVIWRFMEFILVIAIFNWWSRWFPETLRRMRGSLLEIRPRSLEVLRRVRIVWYLEQLRRPLEWLLLFHVFFALIDMPGLNFLKGIIEIVVRWILLGWFSVSLLNAVAARGDAGMAGENARLRKRSLRLIATWLVLLGLGLSLAENLTGIATLHAWVWRLFQILALPVLLILLSWWRKSIFLNLERERESTDSLDNLLKHRKGLRSFSSAASGAVWLMANSLRRRVTRSFLRFSADQGLTSSLTSSQSETASDAEKKEKAPSLAASVREQLLSRGEFYDRYARPERRKLVQRIKAHRSGIVAISGERGIGKSCFLEHVRDSSDDKMILLDCVSGEFAEVEQKLGQALGIKRVDAKHVTGKLTESGIQTIGIDNLHRLVRPVIGGQKELIQLTELIENVSADVLWVISVDRFAWQYLQRARADQAAVNEVLELPPWTEEQLADLFRQRNAESDIEPNFSDVRIPNEYLETALDTAQERNEAGLYRMIWTLSGGNPSVALQIWADCLCPNEAGHLYVTIPTQPKTRELDSVPQNILLVLRAIAQSEVISQADIADNLRLPTGAVGSAMHYCMSRGWIEETAGGYRISWEWFRTITTVLARKNLLAR
ncbi:MAG: hypothetical protein DRR11_12145 [Gammaproteobacteria bacterium]|nr:MAG: hypothetical protein DRR11_12145 [Gammaproteobacteria bacterium]RLA34478.1 MAG: hypothetical protein DRR15_08970 [Gammaproteobacteria bacterium]